MIFFNEKKNQKDSDDFWHRKLTLKVKFWYFLRAPHYSNFQNLVISFEYSWLLAQNLSNFVSHLWKLHKRECRNLDTITLWSKSLNKQVLLIEDEGPTNQDVLLFATLHCKVYSTYSKVFYELFSEEWLLKLAIQNSSRISDQLNNFDVSIDNPRKKIVRMKSHSFDHNLLRLVASFTEKDIFIVKQTKNWKCKVKICAQEKWN